jgi:hypothetical protein
MRLELGAVGRCGRAGSGPCLNCSPHGLIALAVCTEALSTMAVTVLPTQALDQQAQKARKLLWWCGLPCVHPPPVALYFAGR